MNNLKSHPIKVQAGKYPGGETEKKIWGQWFYLIVCHGIFLRKTRRKKLFKAFVRGIDAAKQDDKDPSPYWIHSQRADVYDFGRLFYRYFLKQALDLLNTPQSFNLENLINDAIDERHLV